MKLICIHYHSERGEELPVSSSEFHPEMLEKLHDMGIIDISRGVISAVDRGRIEKALRLKRSLGINLCGTAVILELLDRIEALEEELERLRKAR